MDGMGKQYDGHTWCKTMTSNISNEFGLTFQKSACTGHLQCPNLDCDYIDRNAGKVNFSEWAGLTPSPFLVGRTAPSNSTLVCKVCRTPPLCLASCNAKILYVFCSDQNTTRAALHLGRHVHPYADGVCMEALDQMYNCVADEVKNTPKATNSAIALAPQRSSSVITCSVLLPARAISAEHRWTMLWTSSQHYLLPTFGTLSRARRNLFVKEWASWTVSWH